MIALNTFSNDFQLSPTLAANEAVNRLREQGKTIIHMGFGQAPFPVPERIKDALIANADNNKYMPAVGLKELRDVILAYYKDVLDIDPEQHDVVIAPGSKLILYAAQMAVKGDLLMPVPSWVSYAPQAQMLGTSVIKVPTTIDDEGYHISADDLSGAIIKARKEGHNPTKLILNYPNNPTGLTISDPDLRAIAKVCIEEDILIISDEIYGYLAYDEEYRSIMKYAPDNTLVSSGLSKHLSLGGWRLGFGIIPKSIEGLNSTIESIASETWSCVPSPVQMAVIEAYKHHADIEEYVRDCCAIHSYINAHIAKGLRKEGIKCATPQGAFYVYPDFDPYREILLHKGVVTSEHLAKHLLETYGLVALSGTAFGETPDRLTLRLSACDYDGAKALRAYQSGEALNEEFIARHAPNVDKALERFASCVKPAGVAIVGVSQCSIPGRVE